MYLATKMRKRANDVNLKNIELQEMYKYAISKIKEAADKGETEIMFPYLFKSLDPSADYDTKMIWNCNREKVKDRLKEDGFIFREKVWTEYVTW